MKSSQFLRFGSYDGTNRLDTLVLKNGSLLACIVKSVTRDRIEIQSRIFDLQHISTRQVRGIVFRQKANKTEHQGILDQILTGKRQQVKAVMINQDVASGQLDSEKAENGVRVSFQGRVKSIPISDLGHMLLPVTTSYLIADHAQASRMGLNDGTFLLFKTLSVSENEYHFVINDELTLVAPKKIRQQSLMERITYFQPYNSKIRYLSAASPLKIVENEKATFHRTRFNRSTTGGPLLLGNQIIEWGIGTHSNSQVIFAVQPADQFFRATVTLDGSGNAKGNAVCRILLLGQDNQWKSVSSPINVSKTGDPVAVKVNVEGARAIGLVTTSGQFGPTGDRVNWLDARMHQR